MHASSLLTRRRVLGATTAAATVAFIRPSAAAYRAPRSVSLYNIHTGEQVRAVYWADGHYIRDVVRDINWVLRDPYTDEVRPINAGVLDVLGTLHTRLDARSPFLVISGYRSPATNHMLRMRHSVAGAHSYHIKGMAIDFRCERRDLSQVRRAAVSLQAGGVGYYPHSDFVHVDCGPVRYW